ncbi:sulfite exporter TauE/SafE family protein [Chitinophaga nivalis]|uniref:Probable membrane transporter protein n=1 Tax=Chitinophaga nivalis TaxID=2991709 RepID=A0ABT3ITC4_9BACT|nr:sulfite exporter TauE/SafE family protein [Chitinophaga nivalis]MCW3463084.1 sulfite exporter TauE/SafE family protein [Chitinophaga nivalis]MCW3487226.1 sulfite exporter TauE/SafE family protein [Chitinophaga nivalis]
MGYLQQTEYLSVLLIGLVVGYLSGLLGKGGSAISTPALQIFAGVNPFFALASPLPASITSTLSATAVYSKEKLFNKRVILICAALGVPATVLGSWCSSYLPGKTLMILTALFIITIGISLLYAFLRRKPMPDTPVATVASIPARQLLTAALGIGFLAGLLANAGGILFSSFFIKQLKMPIKQALACAVVLSAILSVPGALTHWWLGHIDWNIALLLSLTAFPASYLGAKTAVKMKTPALEKLFALTLIVFGLYDIFFTLWK